MSAPMVAYRIENLDDALAALAKARAEKLPFVADIIFDRVVLLIGYVKKALVEASCSDSDIEIEQREPM